MENESLGEQPVAETYLQRFLDQLSDPIHRRLIRAYGGDDPVASMEAELAQVLKEVLNRED